MGSDPTTTNSSAALGVSVVNGTFSVAENLVESAIFAEVPFLASPGLKQLVSMGVQYVLNKAQTAIAQMVFDGVISIQVSSEESKLKDATSALQSAQASGDANAIAQAQSNFENSFANLAHYDGSVNH